MMDKQEVTKELADFLKFNATDIYNLGNESPEIAEAFSGVVLAIDKKYGSSVLTKEQLDKELKKTASESVPGKKIIRFKSLEEMDQEYGSWKKTPAPSWIAYMNPRAGTVLTPDELKLMIKAFQKNEFFDIKIGTAMFKVAPWMLTPKPLYAKSTETKTPFEKAIESEVVANDPKKRVVKDIINCSIYWPKTALFLRVLEFRLKQSGKTYEVKLATTAGEKKVMDIPITAMDKLLKGEKPGGFYIKEFVEDVQVPVNPVMVSVPAKTLRPSPSQSASQTPEGTVMKGNDGNNYIVKTNNTGVKQWRPISQSDIVLKANELQSAMDEFIRSGVGTESDDEYIEMYNQLTTFKKFIK